MIQVAWIPINNRSWIGGLNYFRNLMQALLSLEERLIEPVVLSNPADLPSPLNQCSYLPLPRPPRSLPRRIREAIDRKILNNGGNLAKWLAENDIRLLSHANWLGSNSPVPTLCWIPDFQHRRLPEFFSAKELKSRDSIHSAIARHSQAVLLSSKDARADFCRSHRAAAHKAFVLPFVAHVPHAVLLPPAQSVLNAHLITEPFFHIPNQLWAHKNHGVVVDALRILSDRGHCPLVISTGLTEDSRNPGYFRAISRRLEEKHLSDRFRFLGVIPFDQVATLMRSSVALINPSLFEGWSTTVEEAKSTGKRVLLSDIAVHREQSPKRSLYFDPHDPEALAACMIEVLGTYDPAHERKEMDCAEEDLPHRLRQYAKAYQQIVMDVIARH